ncbi:MULTISPECIES: glutathione S-transferase family protein [unclassified Synechococcus]|uniref:glutathione S-transferase family protein n=1 Tax=unclassified Synechococcus TaxID=2626047 RepID=UPI00006983BF|nr:MULTISPECIES: glutathione S-transferase [unclassified Synechococcus]EAQ75657.1 glutathione S-transferase family protein [Synechococcus sp. WH 5701]WFN59665.1 glutathione S-transferase [Synechococcus sp. CCFWC 502]
MITLYGHEISGNSYRPRLLLHLLQLEYRWIRVDLMAGEHKQDAFLALNPAAQVPVLVDGEFTLADSHAILVYLARRYGGDAWLPLDAVGLAEVVRWLAFSAGEIKQGPEHARLHHLLGVSSINIERARQKSEAVLRLLDGHLAVQPWLALGRPTIADVAVYPYIHLAPDGQIDLSPYEHVNAWLGRIEALAGFRAMGA